MTDLSTAFEEVEASGPSPKLCWICNLNEANSGEHKTKRSDLAAVLGNPTQEEPFYYHDQKRPNRPVRSLQAKILKAPIRICSDCNNARTQPHDLAWERMSDWLRNRNPPLKVGDLVRGDRVFAQHARREMKNVHLFFLKLFGCMLAEAEADGKKLPVDISEFAKAIISGRPHPEVFLQFGKCDGVVGRSNLFCSTGEGGVVFAHWLYQLKSIAVSVQYAKGGGWPDVWHPQTGSNRFRVADFRYAKRDDANTVTEVI